LKLKKVETYQWPWLRHKWEQKEDPSCFALSFNFKLDTKISFSFFYRKFTNDNGSQQFWMTIANENIVETVTEYGKLVGTFGVWSSWATDLSLLCIEKWGCAQHKKWHNWKKLRRLISCPFVLILLLLVIHITCGCY